MLGQAASDAVILSSRRPLSWADIVDWPVWPTAHSVRDEEAVGSLAPPLRHELLASIAGCPGMADPCSGGRLGSRAGSLSWWWRCRCCRVAVLFGGGAGAVEGAGGGADVHVEGDADVGVAGQAGDVGGVHVPGE